MHQQARNRLEATSGLIAKQLNEPTAYLSSETEKVKALIRQHFDDHPDLKHCKLDSIFQRLELTFATGIGRVRVTGSDPDSREP